MSLGVIVDSTIESTTKDTLLSVYPNPAMYGKFYLFNCDPRQIDSNIVVDDSITDVVLGDEEGQIPVATFLADIQTLMSSDLTGLPSKLINEQCGVVLRDALFSQQESQGE